MKPRSKSRSIPTDWLISTVGSACIIRNDLRMPISRDIRATQKGKYPYYGPTGILGSINEYRLDGTFALIGEDGDHFLDYTNKAQTLLVTGKFNVNNHAHIIETSDICDAEWFYNYFRHRNIKRNLTRQGAGRYKLNKETLERIPILIPPKKEQIVINAIFRIWDAAIEKTERLIEAKVRRVSWLIKSLIGDKCSNWEHLYAEKIFKSISEKNNDDEELLSVTQDRGVIPRTMLVGRVMSPESGTDTYKLVKEGDFVISLRSFQGGIEYSRYQGLISPAYTVLRPNLKIHEEFYRHFFKTYLFIEKYLNIAVIGIRDGKQISIPDFMTVKIPYPPLEQQKQIASVLNTAWQEIDLLKKQMDVYRKQKRGLMQKLLTGEWRVSVD